MDDKPSTIETDLGHAWDRVDSMIDDFIRLLPNLVLALIVFVLFVFVARGVRALVRRAVRRRHHANLGEVMARVAQWLVLFAGLLVALAIAAPSVKPSDLLALLGIGSVAIGFAFKDILQNFLAGILILLRQPFRVGDQIIFKNFEGTVETIDTRATLVKTYDGRRVVIPNGEIYTNAVIVNTAYGARRSEYDTGIGYGDDIGRAEQVMLAAVRDVEGVLAEPPPEVLPWELAGSSVNLRVRWWTSTPRTDVVLVKARVIRAVRLACAGAGIDLPFPTQVVLFHDQTEETDGDRTRQREGWPAGDDPPKPRRPELPAAEAEGRATKQRYR